LKDYQRNHRPLVGDGVQEGFAAVGVGMLDATICDIYLVDDSGYLVGRPILVALLLLVQAVYVGIRVYVKGCKRARGYY